MTTTSTLPPPLSAPPTVAVLQGLLDGLRQPMRRGVPSPPAPGLLFDETAHSTAQPPALDRGGVLDLTRLEQVAAPVGVPTRDGPDTPAPSGRPHSTPPTVPLTWSAGRAPSHPRRAAAVAAVGLVAGAVAALAATGELALP